MNEGEYAAFPNGAHDDQVDVMTQALLRWHMIPQEVVIQYSQPYQISSSEVGDSCSLVAAKRHG